MAEGQRLEHLRQKVRQGAGGGPQAHTAAARGDLALHGLQQVVGIGQQAPGPVDQQAAGGGRGDAGRRPVQQARAQAGFELRHVQCHRGRCEVQCLGRRGEGAEVGDRQQRAQAVEVDFAHGAAFVVDKVVQDS